jgi:hypothetical protein
MSPRGEELLKEDSWTFLVEYANGLQLWQKFGMYVYYHKSKDTFSVIFLFDPRLVTSKTE